MSESESSKSFMGKPRVRKLRRVNDVLGQYSQVIENAPQVETILADGDRPYARVHQGREPSARLARIEEVAARPWEAAQLRAIEEEPPAWTPAEVEEQPHWSQADQTRWEREEEEARLVREAEAARQAREERHRLEREEAERLARERAAARHAREEEARLAREAESARHAREEEARLAREAEAARMAREEEARLAREAEAARMAREEEARLAREAEAARMAREEEARLAHEAAAARLAREEEAHSARTELAQLTREKEARFAELEEARRAREEAERLAQEAEDARLAREEAAQQAREEVARLAREEAARLAREEAARLAREEAAELARLSEEPRVAPHPEAARLAQAATKLASAAASRLDSASHGTVPSVADDQAADLEDTAKILLPPLGTALTPGEGIGPGLNGAEAVFSEVVAEEHASRHHAPDPGRREDADSRSEVLTAILTREQTREARQRQEDEARHDEQLRREERAKALLEQQLSRLEKQIEEANLREKLLDAQEKVRRKAKREPVEFNLGAWLAGAGMADLRECGDSERRKVCAIGYTVLVPTIFALLSASYAVATLTPNPYVITLVAVAWAFIILLVDRAIIATYSPTMKLVSKVGVITLRFCVAMLMGMTVSHPLTLLLFKDTINAEIADQRDHDLAAAREKFTTQKAEIEGKIAGLHAEVERQRKLYDESYQAKFVKPTETVAGAAAGTLTADEQTILKQRTEDAAAPFRQELAEVATRLQAEEARRVQLQTELDEWQRQFEAEIGGQRSGVSGIGPRARSIQTDQIEWRRTDLAQIAEEVRKLSNRRRDIEASISASGDALRREMERAAAERAVELQREGQRLAGLQKQVQAQQMENFVAQGEEVRKQIQTAIDSGLADLTRLRTELGELTSQEQERLEDLRSNPRQDMLTQTLALHHLFENPENGGHFALVAYLVLAGLFLAIDTMPILVKFTSKPGEYEIRRERSVRDAKEDGILARVPARLRELDPVETEELHQLVVEFYRNDQQSKVHEKQKEALQKEREAIQARAERDVAQAEREAALASKKRETEERERLRELEAAERERKLALARKAAEMEKLELAAKEAEANEAKARARLSRVNLEIAESDGDGFGELLLDARAKVAVGGDAAPTVPGPEDVAEA